ncbi:MAG: ribosome hibernation promotion factor [Gaiellaceae bacterium]
MLVVVTTGSVISRDELEDLVHEYHHVQQEHRHARPGSRVRRHLHERMTELARRFDRLLAEAVADERERRRWHEHLHHGGAQPSAPQAAPPLLFRGHSGDGSTLEILERADGTLDVVVDGVYVERLASAHELLTTQPGLSFRFGEVSFDERFAVSGSARAALQAMIESGGRPPYRCARELLLDGLIDRNFGLTRRGRRALRLDLLEGVARRGELAVPVHVTALGQVSERARHAAEEKLAKLARLAPRPVLFARATLVREADPALERPAIAKATMDVGGRIVRAHVAAPEMSEAIDLLVERLRGRLTELTERETVRRREPGIAEPGRWRHGDLPTHRPHYFPRPREERRLVRRKTFSLEPMSVEEAVWEMRMLDHDFHLFANASTGEENVVYVGDDGAIQLKQISCSDGTLVEPVGPDAAPAPLLEIGAAIEAFDIEGGPFLFFVDRARGRGAVLYRRVDGHYGLIAAAEE